MRAKLILLIVLFGVLWGLKTPVGAMWFYVWVTLFRPQDFTYLPLPNLVPIAFAILSASLMLGLAQGTVKFRWNKGSFHLITVMLVCLISSATSSTSTLAWDKFNIVFKILLPSILISNSISKEKDLQIITMTFASSIGIWAVQASLQGLMGGGAVENMGIGGQMSERNDFAVGVVMTWPLCYYWGVMAENKKVRIAAYTASFFVGLCAIVSNSRGAMLGLFLLLFLNFFRKGTKRGRNFVILLLSIPMIIPMIPQYAIDRLGTIKVGGEQTEGSAKSRTVLMKAGLAGAMDHPLFGVGTGCWGAHYMKYVEKMGDGAYEPHSIWIKMSVELGFIGLGTYLFMLLRIIFNLRRIQKRGLRTRNLKVYNYAAMLQLAIIGYCSAGSFINQIFYEYMFLLVGISGSFIKLYQEGVFDQKQLSSENKTAVRKTGRYQRRAA
ncbi:MAG: hypothetical protein BWK80_04255 [Desulfobacteraceae bacterium IS3]|nr:MAG: hypothetical protein BWK80_04255 [Desulfobacteraceae bacterium IS3]